jgi:threonine aldolase
VSELKQAGAAFYVEPVPEGYDGETGPDEVLTRMVTSFATTEEEVNRFGALVA